MGLMLQGIWQLMNLLCTIAVVLTVPGSSGSILQTPAVYPSIGAPVLQQTNKGPLPFLSPGQSATLAPEHGFAASVPAQSLHDSAPPITAETPQGSTFPVAKPPHDSVPTLSVETPHGQPYVSSAPSAAEPPLVSSLPPAAYPLHDSALIPASHAPPASAPPPTVKPSEAVAPLLHAHSLSSTPLIVPLPVKPPPFFPSPPLAAEPPQTSATPLAAFPSNVVPPLPLVEPPQAVNPPPPLERQSIFTSSPPAIPCDSPPATTMQSPPFPPNASPSLPQQVPSSASPLPLPKGPPPTIPSPLPVVPPEASAVHSPSLSNASSPLPQLVPSGPLPPNFIMPSHALVPPPLTVPLPQEPPPILPPATQAMPPYASTLQPPPVPLNASSPPPQLVPSHFSPPTFIAHPHALGPPPLMEPFLPEAPPNLLSPPPAVPPSGSTLPFPPLSQHASPPPLQLAPSHAPSPTFEVPSHALAPPPLVLPLPTKPSSVLPSPPLILLSPPPAMPPPASTMPFPSVPHATPPPLQLVPSQASPPPFEVPSQALAPPPLVMTPPKEPPSVIPSPPSTLLSPPPAVSPRTSTMPFPSVPPHASPPPLQLVPSQGSPPTFEVPSQALAPPPLVVPPPKEPPSVLPSPPPTLLSSPPVVPPPASVMPFPSAPPHASPPPIQLVPSHASPPTFDVPSHALAPLPMVMPPPKEPPSVLPSPSPAMAPHASTMHSPPITPHESSPFPYLAPPQASPTFFVPPPLTRPPHALSTLPPTEIPHTFPPPFTTLPGAIPPHASSPLPMSGCHSATPLVLHSPPYGKSHSYAPHCPTMPGTVHPVPPHVSQRKETLKGTTPPGLASPEPTPSARILPRRAPSVHEIMPSSHSPISSQIEAPNHGAPFWRSNASGSITSIAPSPLASQVHRPSVQFHYPPRHSPVKGTSPFISPSTPNFTRRSNLTPMPAALSPKSSASEGSHSSAVSPSPSIHKHPRDEVRSLGPASVLAPPTAPSSQQVQAETPSLLYAPQPSPVAGHRYNPSSPPRQGSPVVVVPSPSPSEVLEISPVTSKVPLLSPKISPSGSSTRNTKPLASPIQALPPPPPNQDCAYLTCMEPLTNSPPGSPCRCVWPMQVGLRLSVALYTFFPLVSELAREIAAGVVMKQSQVRVMGASAAGQEPDKTIVIIDLVPFNEKFDYTTAMQTSQRFWHEQVSIDKSIFGDYDVLYVHYPGLPPSPPMAPSDAAVIDGMPYSVGDPNRSKLHPLGVDVPKQRHKHKLNGSLIAVIIFSAIVGVLICGLVVWVLLFRHTNRDSQSAPTPHTVPSLARSSGPTGHSNGSGQSSPLSLRSSLAAYTGSAKTFSASEIEKATDNFISSGILGEGGFGCVYRGILEDGTSVAVKVLKRDDQQGGREFLAEVEMLGRLHHRNLVKLIGICIDERMRCLVYELVPNGSVDSHLHGPDKETAPLDWASRLKIALGAARGLAYLHEDSSPRVIHRDFKSSNILLENDFTPKVSDFGLARTALDEENRHISTRVMGTFGYVAPEYAMTGHLLVKSDVYSYGVVLLELLTGRKPVDMSQPPGQENLVAWTRPLLTTKEGLESIIDPSLGADVPFDNVVKVAAIASMCVQPEVSHRPFMGEVVQALKLVCTECDDSKDGDHSRSLSRENLSIDFDGKPGLSPFVGETLDPLQAQLSPHGFPPRHDLEKGLSVSEIFSVSTRVGRQGSGSLRRHSASGPIRTSKGPRFWQKLRRLSQGSVSEHGIIHRSWAGSY